MMDTKKIIKEVIESHNLMHIATISLDGTPQVRGVDYVMGEDETELYFITNKLTKKVNEIEKNNKVSIVIDHDCENMEKLSQLKYIKGSGEATILKTPEEVQKVFGLVLQKFPYLKDLPGEPTDYVGVRVKLNKIVLTDNTKGFGNMIEVKY
jgi:general stress protein 26